MANYRYGSMVISAFPEISETDIKNINEAIKGEKEVAEYDDVPVPGFCDTITLSDESGYLAIETLIKAGKWRVAAKAWHSKLCSGTTYIIDVKNRNYFEMDIDGINSSPLPDSIEYEHIDGIIPFTDLTIDDVVLEEDPEERKVRDTE